MITIGPSRSRLRPRGAAFAAVLAASLAVAASGPAVLATHTAGHERGGSARAGSARAGQTTDADVPDLDEATAEELRIMVGQLAEERDALADSLARFTELYDPLEADRQLLYELRKGVPETRPEAEAQVARLRTLALSSDPSRLGMLMDRVADAAPDFFDWRFTEFQSSAEATQAYIESGANAFDTSMTEFRNEVLLSVANRLDGLLTTIDRAR